MNLKYKIAIINHPAPDGLARTVLDGMCQLKDKNSEIEFALSSKFEYNLPLDDFVLPENEFVKYAKQADYIFLIYCKRETYFKLAEKINEWQKTIYIDGSEVGHNRRYDFVIQKKIIDGKWKGAGGVNSEMLKRCAFYFKREKPYHKGVIPLPFGIESRYLKYYKSNTKKDIDFFCVFGQDEYPLMRRFATEILKKFCKKNKFKFHIKKTKSPDKFYQILARSKVGVSIGGGGFDSYRFWEILGNNCLLLTEKIDIYQIDSKRLNYKRIWQFNNLYDFEYQLKKIGQYLRNHYVQENLEEEYRKILNEHSSEARVREILSVCKNKGVI